MDDLDLIMKSSELSSCMTINEIREQYENDKVLLYADNKVYYPKEENEIIRRMKEKGTW